MQLIFSRFATREAPVQGFNARVTRGRVTSLPDDIKQVPINALDMWDAAGISYREATDDEVEAAQVLR